MSNNHYVVAHLGTSWQFSIRGSVTGPFDTEDEAIEAAVAAAAESEEPDAEVLVRDANMTTETVWKQPA